MVKSPIQKPKSSDFLTKNGHCYLKGSEEFQIDDYKMYVSTDFLWIITYKDGQVVHNQQFHTLEQMKEKQDYFMKHLKKKVVPVHKLKIGDVLVLNTNIHSIQDNQVKYYRILDFIDGMSVILQQLDDDRILKQSNGFEFFESVPVVKDNHNPKFAVKVIMNSVSIDGALALLHTPNITDIAGVKIKSFTPQQFGLKKSKGSEND